MRTRALIIAISLLVASSAFGQEQNGTALTGDYMHMWLVESHATAQTITGFSLGATYRPTATLDDGSTRPSRFIFNFKYTLGAMDTSGVTLRPSVLMFGMGWQLTTFEGVDIFLGGNLLAVGNSASSVSMGGTAEAVFEFTVGNQTMQFLLGGGYIAPDYGLALESRHNRYPVYVKLGARS